MSSTTGNSDPYLYPGTNVLKNLRGLTDPGLLARFEARRTHRRITELIDTPLTGKFDIAHFKAIHRYIFQDVFEWAGEFRTVNISKSGDPFAFHQHIGSCLDNICTELQRESHLSGCGLERFATRGAYYLGEINAVH